RQPGEERRRRPLCLRLHQGGVEHGLPKPRRRSARAGHCGGLPASVPCPHRHGWRGGTGRTRRERGRHAQGRGCAHALGQRLVHQLRWQPDSLVTELRMAAPVEFYFDFASPYGYLASTQIDAIAERHGRSVDWHPMLLGAVFRVTGGQPLTGIPMKGEYTAHDLLRFAGFLDVPFRMPDPMPMHPVAAARAYYWREQAEGPGPAKVFAKAMLHAHFGEGRDLSRPDAIAELADA